MITYHIIIGIITMNSIHFTHKVTKEIRARLFRITMTAIRGFRNEILSAWQKYLNVEVILIFEFVISEIRIHSTFGLFPGWQAGWLAGCQDFISKNLYCLQIGRKSSYVLLTWLQYLYHPSYKLMVSSSLQLGLSRIGSICSRRSLGSSFNSILL